LSQLPLSLAQQFEDSIWLQPVDAVSERGGCTLPGKTFIWLPFAGGISAFAVILPKPGLRLRRFGQKGRSLEK
jgi:hypothetical protein